VEAFRLLGFRMRDAMNHDALMATAAATRCRR